MNLELWDRGALKCHIDEPLQGLRKDDAERNTDSGGSTFKVGTRIPLRTGVETFQVILQQIVCLPSSSHVSRIYIRLNFKVAD